MRWLPTPEATYYNVQLFRGSQKVLSIWPTASKLKVPAKWVYARRRFSLTPGTYRWFVFPGFGAKQAAKYGPALGKSTFVVVRAKKSR